jgi:hypothetical protein
VNSIRAAHVEVVAQVLAQRSQITLTKDQTHNLCGQTGLRRDEVLDAIDGLVAAGRAELTVADCRVVVRGRK